MAERTDPEALADLVQRVQELEAHRDNHANGGLAQFESAWICREAGKGNWQPWKARNQVRRKAWLRRLRLKEPTP